MDGCGESVNPYLACSDKLQQFRNFTIEEFRAEVRQLQTATSQWYLSILTEQDCLDDLAENCTLGGRNKEDQDNEHSAHDALLDLQGTLHLHGRNSRESSTRGNSLRSGQTSLMAEHVSSLHTGAVSSINGYAVSPLSPERQNAQRTQQPSLLDLCPTIFGTLSPDCIEQTEGATTPAASPGKAVDTQQRCSPQPVRLRNSPAMSLTSMCPSIEHLLDGAEDGPIEAVRSLSSRSSSPYSAAMLHPKSDTNAPQSMLDLQPSVIGCFSSSSSENSASAPGATAPDAPAAPSGVSTCMRSTIPAFHQGPEQEAVSEPSLATASDSGGGAVPVFCHGVAASLMHDPDLVGSMRAETECTDDCSRVADFGIQSWSSTLNSSGLNEWLGRHASLQAPPETRRSLPSHSQGGGLEGPGDEDFAPLRRSKSLAPGRRSMLTPAADCEGGQLLPEVPLLQTYKNARPPRPRRAHFKSSVVILDSPTVNVYEAHADTVSMTVSAISQPRPDSSQHRRRTRNRRRGSYMNARSVLDFAERAEPHLEPLRESGPGDGGRTTEAGWGDAPFPACKASPVQAWQDDSNTSKLSCAPSKCTPSKIMDTQDLPATQVSCERHGGLRASLEVLCQALIDSRHLSVCLELGLKLSSPPTWIEMLSLLLRSLETPARSGSGHHLRSTDVSEICHQIALVFFPIGSAMTAMQRNLMLYVESAGCHAPRRSHPNEHVPACPPLGSPVGSVYTSERLADAWNRSGQELVATEFEGRPGEYLTQLLPRVMFDYIASLVSVGMRIDAVAQSHGVSCTKALDIIKSQVGVTLEGLSMLTSTLVHTVMAVCQGNIATADIGGLLSSLSPFLGVSLEHMAASVSLINGRMPLNTTDEALQELVRAERTWYQQCTASTAFFHCLSVCGHMLTILEGLEGDLAIWQRSEQDSPAIDLLPGAQLQTPVGSLCGDCNTGSEGGGSSSNLVRDPPSQRGYQWQILFDVVPKVQATSSRLVMLVGSLIKSASGLGDDSQRSPSVRASPSILGQGLLSPHASGDHGRLLAGGLSPASLQPPVAAPPTSCATAPAPTLSSGSPLRLTRSGRTSTRTPQPSLRLSIPSVADDCAAVGVPRLSGMCSAAAAAERRSPAPTPKPSASMSASACRTARRLFSPRSCLPCISNSRSEDNDDSDDPTAAPALPPPRVRPPLSPPQNVLRQSPAQTRTDSFTKSLTPPPGLSRLQVSDGASGQGDALLLSPLSSAFTTCPPPASPGQSRTPRHSIANLRGRSFRNLRSPSLAIEEPVRAWGLGSEEHPMSPVAQLVQRRINSETLQSLGGAPPFAPECPPSLSRGSCATSMGALETPPPSLQPRDVSCQSASALLQPHANRDVSKSMVITSLSHALGTDSSASSPFQKLSGAPSGMGAWEEPAYPTCLTVREVARVQEALAQGVVSLGIRVMQLLLQRCKAVVPAVLGGVDADAEPQQQRTVADMLTRCQAAAQAQLSMSHNMQRWTNVLPGSMEIPETVAFHADGSGCADIGPYGSLKEAAEQLREVTGTELRRVGAAGGESRLRPGRLVELLLGSAVKPLGKKSLGSVWMHHLGRELVAVKWITIEDDVPGRGYTAAQKQSMLIREVEAMMRLQHPNIVRLLGVTTMVTPLALATVGASSGHHLPEVGTPPHLTAANSRSSSSGTGLAMAAPLEQATVGIVLELCMYGTLQDFLNQTRALFNNSSRIRAAPEGGLVLRQGACTSPLEAMCLCFINSWSQRLRLCREIAAALAACHAAGVLHRDLTSFNVMLSDMLEAQPGAQNWALCWRETNEDGEAEDMWSLPWATRLIDFGLSKHSMDQPLDAHASIDVHSIPWMAPEMFISTQHLQASDVYGLGMVIWEVLSTHKPPTSNIQTYIATGLAFSGATRDSPGPCEAELAQLLSMHERGDIAVLMRRLHGVPCPVLPELVSLIRDTQRYRPQDRITAAEAARRLAKLEAVCADVPPAPVPQEDQELARYWRDTAEAVEEVECELAPFSSTSSMTDGDDSVAPWVHQLID